jgi:hypothetical protein
MKTGVSGILDRPVKPDDDSGVNGTSYSLLDLG